MPDVVAEAGEKDPTGPGSDLGGDAAALLRADVGVELAGQDERWRRDAAGQFDARRRRFTPVGPVTAFDGDEGALVAVALGAGQQVGDGLPGGRGVGGWSGSGGREDAGQQCEAAQAGGGQSPVS